MGNAGSACLDRRLFKDSWPDIISTKKEEDDVLLSHVQGTKLYSFEELLKATDSFSSDNKIGAGGFGNTYRGVLGDGTLIAAKVMYVGSNQGSREFINEISTLAELEHVNLIKLHGCCVNANRRILVYDYLVNGDLQQALFGGEFPREGSHCINFTWDVRRRICIGVAEGLAFLHNLNIVHRDIKATNIFLDGELIPKISDFGLAKLLPPEGSPITERIVGAIGYIAPEYATDGLLTTKADVYSFGVLMMEIFSGRSITGRETLDEGNNLLDMAWDLHESVKLLAMADETIMKYFDQEETYKYLIIHLLCTQHDPDLRPDMSTVVGMLTGKTHVSDENLQRPKILSPYMSPEVNEGKYLESKSSFPSPETVYTGEFSDLEDEGTILRHEGVELSEPPDTEEWLNAKEIYLTRSRITELPESPKCPILRVLYLNENNKLRRIPVSFFENMPALQVLNLSRTRIKNLPDSFFQLHWLRRLFLSHCELLTVLSPKIGELVQLEVLDLSGTEIIELPKEVANLTNLRCLRLAFCGDTDSGCNDSKSSMLIPGGIISTFHLLEELSIDVDPEDERWERTLKAISGEIYGLRMLSTLELYFPQVEQLQNFNLYIRPIEHFKFTVGCHANRIMSRFPEDLEKEFQRFDRCLAYVNGVGVTIDVKKVLQHSTAFFLDRHQTATKLSEFGIGNMQQLNCCIIGECNEFLYLLDGLGISKEEGSSEIIPESSLDSQVLGSLQFLHIYYMENLRGIFTGPYQHCLYSLKFLTLQTCPQLAIIFTPQLLGDLSNLEEIIVEDCELVTSLVTCEVSSIHENHLFLPKLKRLSLHYLPQLESISRGLRMAPDLELISIYHCPILRLSMEEVGSKSSTKIEGKLHQVAASSHSLSFNLNQAKSANQSAAAVAAAHTNPNPNPNTNTNTNTKGGWTVTAAAAETTAATTTRSETVYTSDPTSRGHGSPASDCSHPGVNLIGCQSVGNNSGDLSSKVSSVPQTPKTEGGILQISNLRRFSIEDLRTATRNFRVDSVLGEGSSGCVFKGWIDEHTSTAAKPGTGLVVAVKRLNTEGFQGRQEWLAKINFLGLLYHTNIVKLIGYCLEDEHRLLVYEFMPRGSLENHLFRRSSSYQPLTWKLRLKVALGSAKGLAFLHSDKANVIFRDFKASNILLDSNYDAKLSDFGLAKDGPSAAESHISTRVMRTYGYAAPEYIATGPLLTKCDVYSFGVVLLEMLCGRRLLDRNRPSGEQNLIEWAKPFLSSKRKIHRAMDIGIEGQYSLSGALKAANLAVKCLSRDPRSRPNMNEVVQALEKLKESEEKVVAVESHPTIARDSTSSKF